MNYSHGNNFVYGNEQQLYKAYEPKTQRDKTAVMIVKKHYATQGRYPLDYLRRIGEKIPKSNTLQQNPTRGYISLLSYIKEQENYLRNEKQGDDGQSSWNKYTMKGKTETKEQENYSKSVPRGYNNQYSWKKYKTKTKTELKEVNKNSFRTTKVLKEVGLWDKDSDDAFRNKVNNELNRLTKNNIDDVVKNFDEFVWNDGHISYFVDSLVIKASMEHSFSELYAIFTSKIKLEKLRTTVVQKTSDMFKEICSGDSDFHKANGCSKFISSLVNLNVIGYDLGVNFIKMIIEKLQGGVVSEQHVEMLNSFLLISSEDFIKYVPKDFWDEFFIILKQKLPSRIYFLLNDIEDIYKKYILGISVEIQEFQDPLLNSDENIKCVRNSFVNYREGEEASCNLNCSSFLDAVCKIFPDYLKDSYLFIEFVCDCLSQITTSPNEISDILSRNFQYFRKNKIEADFINIWCIFDDFLCMLLIKNLIKIKEYRKIIRDFPREYNTNIDNSIKWFIYDHFEFYEPIYTTSIYSQEIKDALAMPKTIENPLPPNLLMSRLIALSIIRSILAKVSEDSVPIDSISKYKDYLKYTYEKQQKVFIDEFQVALENYDYGFTLDDIQMLLRK